MFSIISCPLFLIFSPDDTGLDYLFSAELFFNAWLMVLIVLLSIMIVGLIPSLSFNSESWHKPSGSISLLLFWQEPINFLHYVAVSASLSAFFGAGLSVALTESLSYPLHVLALGAGIFCGISTAPMLFKGNYAGNSNQP